MGKEAKYVVRLSAEERRVVENLVTRGRVAKATRQRAQVLLRADEGEAGPGASDEQIAELVGVSLSTVHRTRQRLGRAREVLPTPNAASKSRRRAGCRAMRRPA